MEFEELPGGLTVPAEAFNFLFELLNRGLSLVQDGDRLRVSGPDGARPVLSESDVERIKKWKHHLIALLAYRPPPGALGSAVTQKSSGRG